MVGRDAEIALLDEAVRAVATEHHRETLPTLTRPALAAGDTDTARPAAE